MSNRSLNFAGQCGAGLIEVSISLLVLSIGALGLGGLQITAKRIGYEAIQRTEASALAMDILERMRVNRAALSAYSTVALGEASGAQLAVPTDCDDGGCSSLNVAAWDLWQWEQALDGATTGSLAGGLVRPLACVTINGRRVVVEITWQGFRTLSTPPGESSCGDGDYGPDEGGRQVLRMSSWIGED